MHRNKLNELARLAESGDLHGAAMAAVRLLMDAQHPGWSVATVVAHACGGEVIGSHRLTLTPDSPRR